MNVRKWNNILHRDLGYFFTGTIIIYCISGVAVNHIDHWNPNFIIKRQTIKVESPLEKKDLNKDWVMKVLQPLNESSQYRSHDFPTKKRIKIYLKDGSVSINLATGQGTYEVVHRRPLFYHVNYLHLHPKKWWRIFSDVFAISLIVISITGLFVLRGKKGITGRGAWLVAAGLAVPLLFLFTL